LQLKKDVPGFTSLAAFFVDFFGAKGSTEHDLAQRNFVESMAAYSVVCYFLQIKVKATHAPRATPPQHPIRSPLLPPS
jgi:hypothetical protein